MIDVAEIEVATIRAYRNTGARRACEQTKVRIPFDMSSTHVPVLAGELIELLDPQPGDVVIDCTFGAGGHAALIADLIGPEGRYIAIDRDPAAAGHFSDFAAQAPCRTRLVQASFADALAQLSDEGLVADIVFADFGMSSMQVDTWGRGFSYSYDAPLDMRMDPEQALDAATIVNTWDCERLAKLLREYGEERYAKQIARAIERERANAPITTTPRSSSRSSAPRSRRRRVSVAGTPPSAASRRSGSRSTTSSGRSMWRCRWPGTCCARTAGLQGFHSIRLKTAA